MAVRITLLIKKLDSLSYEDFYKYWEGPHAELFLSVPVVKEKVLKFSQFHTDRNHSDKLAAIGWSISEYDGEVNLWFATMEDLMTVLIDSEYQRLVVPDGKNFSKADESKVMIGYDKNFIRDKGSND